MKIRTSISLIFVFALYFLNAQDSNIRKYNVAALGNIKGLNSSDISALYQDDDGYIWVGTKPGVSKFDGYEFKNFIKANDKSLGQIHTIISDSEGTLWIGGINGIFYYDNGQFNKAKVGDLSVQILILANDNKIWVGGLGFVPFALSPSQLSEIKSNQSLSPKGIVSQKEWLDKIGSLRVWAMDSDNQDNIWFGLDNRHAYFDGSELQVTWKDSTVNHEYKAIAAFSPDSVYWGSEEAPLFLSTKNNIKPLNAIATYIFAQTDSSTFFLTTEELLELKNDEMISLYKFSTYSNLYFKKMIIDREGNFWIGAAGDLLKLTPNYLKTWSDINIELLHSNHSIAQHQNGDILIGSTRKDVLKVEDEKFEMFTQLDARINSYTSSIYTDNNGWIWYGTTMSGIFLERDGGQYHYNIEDGLVDKGIYFITRSNNGALWAGGEHGISRIIIDDNKNVSFENFKTNLKEDDFPIFRTIIESPNGMTWAVSDKGLFLVKDRKLESWSFSEPLTPNPIFTSATSDNNDQIWLGTQGEGLWQCRFDENDKPEVIKQWSSTDGLLSNVILNVLVDKNNHVWSIGQDGICRMDYLDSAANIKCYDQSDGWLKKPASHLDVLESQDGYFWAVSGTGVIKFPLYNLPQNMLKPKTFILEVQLFEGKEDIYEYAKNTKSDKLPVNLKLPYNKNFLRFNFTTSSHSNVEKNKFKYILEGLDPDWNVPNTNRTVLYPGLKPGHYTFNVVGFNNDGVMSENPAVFSFQVLPPWNRTWWALGLFTLILGTLIYWIYNFNLKQKLALAESQKLKEIDLLKNNLYANITHEFRTPLTVILGMAESLKSMVNEKSIEGIDNTIEMIDRNGRNLLNLVNEMLDLSKLENGKMELQLVRSNIVPFIKYLGESFHSFAEDKKIGLTIYSEIDELEMDFDPQKMSIVLSNLLSNAIKFTEPGGKIIVHVKKEINEQLLIKIIDDGIGLSESEISSVFDRFYQSKVQKNTFQTGTGIGLALTKELVELMQGKITLTSLIGKGSTFEILLPVTKNAVLTNAPDFQLGDLMVPKVGQQKVDALAMMDDVELPLALIIEDNLDVASYIKSCLDGRYRTLMAGHGKEGVELAYEKIPDIIISDVMMPEMNGFEVCAELKTDERTDHIPIVLLTAKVSVKDRITGLSHGADAYLAKPFVKMELLTRLDQLILLRKKLLEKLGGNSFRQILVSKAESPETNFLQKVISAIHKDISHPSLNATYLSQKLQLSESQVYRKLKATSGKSTAIFIRLVRLEKGKELLQTGEKTISEVAYDVGFADPSYFSRAFKDEFGYTPSAMHK